MINPYKIRKFGAFLIMSFLPAISLAVGMIYYSFMIGVVILLIMTLVCLLLANIMIRNPFSLMVEGAGILVFDISSTGIIRPFIVSVDQPYIRGKAGNEVVNDVYDREAVLQLAAPAKAGIATIKKGKINLVMDEDLFNRARFGLFQYPVLIYNSQIKSCITKDYLSEQEKNSFAEHTILYLNRKLEELTSVVRDFGRYVVELTKPKGSFFSSPLFRWIAIILIVLVLALLAKPFIEQMMGSDISNPFTAAFKNNPVVPQK